jgi:phasin family protein
MNNASEKLMVANKANVETMVTLANTAFASAERLAALNLNTARSMLEDTVGNVKTLMSIKNPQELMSLQSTLAQPALDKAVAYSRAVYEIATQTQEVLGKLFEGQVAEINNNVSNALDKAAKNAPAGADVAIAAVKSAIAASNTAFDTMNKAAKQASEMAEANVAAATSAALKTMKAA